jgi:hypothetical protein
MAAHIQPLRLQSLPPPSPSNRHSMTPTFSSSSSMTRRGSSSSYLASSFSSPPPSPPSSSVPSTSSLVSSIEQFRRLQSQLTHLSQLLKRLPTKQAFFETMKELRARETAATHEVGELEQRIRSAMIKVKQARMIVVACEKGGLSMDDPDIKATIKIWQQHIDAQEARISQTKVASATIAQTQVQLKQLQARRQLAESIESLLIRVEPARDRVIHAISMDSQTPRGAYTISFPSYRSDICNGDVVEYETLNRSCAMVGPSKL